MKKDIIPLIVLKILLLISIGVVMFSNTIFNYKHYFAIVLIGISSFLYFKNKKLFIYFFGFTLILGALNIIDAFYINVIFGIGFLTLNPIFLILLIVFLWTHKDFLRLLEKRYNEKHIKKKEIKMQENIKAYESKYQSKTELELKNISDDKNGFVEGAKIAARNILNNRNR